MERKTGQLDKALAWAQIRKKRVIRAGELGKALGLTSNQERRLLTYLCKRKLFVKIMSKLYLAPSYLPPGGWAPSPYLVLYLLMKELKADYQITGLHTFNIYQFSTQVPQVMAVYNTVISSQHKIVGQARFQFFKVNKDHLGETNPIRFNEEGFEEGLSVPRGSLARTIFDAVYDYKRFGTLPAAYTWLKKYKNDEALLKKLVDITIKFGNVGTQRRIGFVLAQLGVSEKITHKLWKVLPKTFSLIPLIPHQLKRGPINQQWGIINNG